MMRLQNATPAELQAAGIDAAGMGSPRKDISTFLSSVAGVQNIAADGKSFRNAFEVLGDIAKQWSGYNGMQRSAIAEQLAGKNSANGFYSLMENWDAVQKSYETGRNAQGSADRELANASDSVAFKMKQVQASLEDLSTNFLTSGMLKTGAMSLNSLIQGVNGVVKTVGGPGALGIALGGKDALTSLFTGQGLFSTLTHSILGDQNYEKGNGFKNLGKVLNLLGNGAKDLVKGNALTSIGKEVANGAKAVGKDVSTSAMKAIAKDAGNQILRNGGTAEQAGNAAKAAAAEAAYNGFGTVNGTVISSKSGKLSTAWASLSGIGKFGVIAGAIVTGITAVVAGFKALDKQIGITSKQSFKNADSAYKQYENASQNLNTTEQKLTDNAEQRKELSKKQNRTLKEQAKLEDLNAENTELTTKKQTQEVAKRLKGQQAAEKASHAMDVEFKGNETSVTNLQDWAKSISDYQKRGTDIQLPDNLNSFQTTLSQYAAAGELAKNGTKAQQAEAKGQIKNLSKSVNKGINDSLKALKIFRGVGYDNLTAGQKKAYNVAESNLNAGYYAQYAAAGEPEKWAQQRMGTLWDDYITKNGKAINREMQAFDKNFNIGDYIDGAWAEGLARIADLTGSGKVSVKNLSGSMKDFAKQFEDAGLSKYINNINSQAREAQQSASDLANTVRNGKQVAASNTDTVMTEAKRRAEIKKNVDAAESMSSSASGMSYEQATLMSTQGFGSALERTGSGIRLNQQKYNLLQQTQLQTELADKTDDLNRAYDDYYDNLNAINKLQREITSSGGKATDDQAQRLQTLNQSHRILAQNIENEKNALASIGGENSAVNRFLNAGSGPSDVQDNVAKGLSQVQQDIKKGRVSTDRVRQMVNMAHFGDTSGWSNKQIGESASSSLKRMTQYGSFDKEGNFTFDEKKLKSAMNDYQNYIRKAGNPTFTLFDQTNKKINGTKQAVQGLAKYLDMDQSVVQQAIDSQKDYGYDVQTIEAGAKTLEQRIRDSKEETKALNENEKARKEYLKDQQLMNDQALNSKYQAGKAANATNNKAVQQGVRNDLNGEIDRVNQARVRAAAKGDGQATQKLNDALAQRLMLRENLDSGAKNQLMNVDPQHVNKTLSGFVSSVQQVQKAQNELSVANQLQAQGIYADTDAAKGKVKNTVDDLTASVQTALQSGNKETLKAFAQAGLNQNSTAAQINAALTDGKGGLNTDMLNKIKSSIEITIKEKYENGKDNGNGKGGSNNEGKGNNGKGGSNNGKDSSDNNKGKGNNGKGGSNNGKDSSDNNKGKGGNEPKYSSNKNKQNEQIAQRDLHTSEQQAEKDKTDAEAIKQGHKLVQEYSKASSPKNVPTLPKNATEVSKRRQQVQESYGTPSSPKNAPKIENPTVKQGQQWAKQTYGTNDASKGPARLKNTPYSLMTQGQQWAESNNGVVNTPSGKKAELYPWTNPRLNNPNVLSQVSAAQKTADQAQSQRDQTRIQNANQRANNARQGQQVDAVSHAAVQTATKQADDAETKRSENKKLQANSEFKASQSKSGSTALSLPGMFTGLFDKLFGVQNVSAAELTSPTSPSRMQQLQRSQRNTTLSGNIPGTNIPESQVSASEKAADQAENQRNQRKIQNANKRANNARQATTVDVTSSAAVETATKQADTAETQHRTAKKQQADRQTQLWRSQSRTTLSGNIPGTSISEPAHPNVNQNAEQRKNNLQVSQSRTTQSGNIPGTNIKEPEQTVKVKTEADTSGLQKGIEGATKGKTAKVDTEADTSKLNASIDSATKGKQVSVDIIGKFKAFAQTATGLPQQTPTSGRYAFANGGQTTPRVTTPTVVQKSTSTKTTSGTAELTPKIKGKVKATGTAELTPKVKGKVKATGTATLTPKVKGKVKASGTANLTPKVKGKVTATGKATLTPTIKGKAKTLNAKAKYTGDFSGVGQAPKRSGVVHYTGDFSGVGQAPKRSGVVHYTGDFSGIGSAPSRSGTVTYHAVMAYEGTAHAGGTASRIVGHSFATGSATDDKDETGSAYAGGRYTVGRNETALVNELGPELIVRGNQFLIANGGKPGFTELKASKLYCSL